MSLICLHLKHDMYHMSTWEKLNILKGSSQHTIFEEVAKYKLTIRKPDRQESLEVYRPGLECHLQKLLSSCRSKNSNDISHQLLKRIKGLAKFQVCKMEVFQFMRLWALKFVPVEILGDRKNMNRYLVNLKVILGGGRMCQIRLESITRGLELARIPWLSQDSSSAPSQELIFSKVVKWLTEKVLWMLIKSFFHISDTSYGKYELFFFRKSQFQSRLNQSLSTLTQSKTLTKVSARSLDKILSMDVAPALSQARLMPKASGFRLISWRKKTESQEIERFRVILSYLKKVNYSESVDPRGKAVYQRWGDFVKQNGGKNLYFVCTDIKNAFPSINLHLLGRILKTLSGKAPQFYYIKEIHYVSSKSNRVKIKRVVHETPGSPANISKNCRLISEQESKIEVSKYLSKIRKYSQLQTLQFHIGNKKLHFLRTNGLVQGDSLSSCLCDIYYGHMVTRYIKPLLGPNSGSTSMFVRTIDDFLFVSPDKHLTTRFLTLIRQGFPEYNCVFRHEKTITNLHPKFDPQKKISYCGITLDPNSLQVQPDFSSYFGRSKLVHSLRFATRNGSISDIDFISQKMSFLATLKLDPIYLDETINPKEVVYATLWRLFYLLALRYECLSNSLNVYKADTLLSIIHNCKKKIWMVINRMKRSNVATTITATESEWLLFDAFHAKLRWNPRFGKNIKMRLKTRAERLKNHVSNEGSIDPDSTKPFLKPGNLVNISSRGYQCLK